MSGFPKLLNHLQSIFTFLPGKGGFLVVLTFLMVFGGGSVVGQNGVTITSIASPGPTKVNPIPVIFKFNEKINDFTLDNVIQNNGILNNFFVQTPEYNFLDFYDLEKYTITTINYSNELKKTIISVAINSKDEIFALTQGNGIKKFSPNGISQTFPVGGSYFTSPIDIAINSNDEIYIADNSDRKIYVFTSNGTPLPGKTRGAGNNGGGPNAFRGPIGLEFDQFDNLFVADRYKGSSTETFERNMVKIFYANGEYYEFYGKSTTDKFNSPYRLALDKRGFLYVSDLGNNNPRVQIFDVDEQGQANYIQNLGTGKIDSPGSIVIDDYGFIYVADFGPDLNIVDILSLEGSGIFAILNTLNKVISGIQNNAFNIKVFDSRWEYRRVIEENIDLPVDLALDKCGRLYVNNLNITPSSLYTFDFDLEFYNRLPDTFNADFLITSQCDPATLKVPIGIGYRIGNNGICNSLPLQPSNEFSIIWDATDPIITCPGDQIENYSASTGFTLPDYRSQSTATDNCGTPSISQSPAPGTIINQDAQVILRATDSSGNFHECNFMVELSEEVVLDITCPQPQTESLGANCEFTVPEYRSLAQVNENGATVTQNPVAGTIVSASTPITLTATLGNETDSCVFQLTLSDNIDPIITCPSDQIENYSASTGFTLPDYRSQSTATDNCGTPSISQSPAPGIIINQDTQIILRTTDSSGNFHECNFIVELFEEVVLEITCPANITRNVDPGICGAIVNYATPTATDNSGSATITLKSGPASGSLFPVGLTTVTFESTDIEGNKAECSFTVTVSGSCIEIPETDFPYIFIYPNPTPGPFTFDTPNGWSIEKVEVFDARGRYVLTEAYSENQVEYSMNLSSLQQAVYILKLYTSQGIKILRVIIY